MDIGISDCVNNLPELSIQFNKSLSHEDSASSNTTDMLNMLDLSAYTIKYFSRHQ